MGAVVEWPPFLASRVLAGAARATEIPATTSALPRSGDRRWSFLVPANAMLHAVIMERLKEMLAKPVARAPDCRAGI